MSLDKKYIYPSGKNAKKTAEEVFRLQYSEVNSGCYEWIGKLFPNGYGCFYYKGQYLLAHRVSVEWACDRAIGEVIICHSCDNRKCVNPNHLILADQKFNINDMISKGRGNWLKGSENGKAKLSEQDVTEIKRLRYDDGWFIKDIAKLFSVSEKQISVVSRGLQWSHHK